MCASRVDGAHWSRVEGPSPFGAILEWPKRGLDEAYAGYPSVIEVGGEYRMYYHTYDRKDGMYKVGLAVAKEASNWTKKGMVFAGSKSGDFDRKGATRRHVVNMEDARTNGMRCQRGGAQHWRGYQPRRSEMDGSQ